jgi:hypothetical protein
MLSIDLRGIEQLEALPTQVEAAVEKGLDRTAEIVFEAKLQQMQKTYDRVIPTRAQYAKNSKKARLKAAGAKRVTKKQLESVGKGATGSQPAWERSGDWENGQHIVKAPGQRTIKTEGNATKYEKRLAELPKGPDGVNRRNAAAAEAARITKPQLQRAFEQEVENALR